MARLQHAADRARTRRDVETVGEDRGRLRPDAGQAGHRRRAVVRGSSDWVRQGGAAERVLVGQPRAPARVLDAVRRGGGRGVWPPFGVADVCPGPPADQRAAVFLGGGHPSSRGRADAARPNADGIAAHADPRPGPVTPRRCARRPGAHPGDPWIRSPVRLYRRGNRVHGEHGQDLRTSRAGVLVQPAQRHVGRARRIRELGHARVQAAVRGPRQRLGARPRRCLQGIQGAGSPRGRAAARPVIDVGIRAQTTMSMRVRFCRTLIMAAFAAAAHFQDPSVVSAQDVPVWGRFEAAFTAARDYDNPLYDVPRFAVHFTSATERKKTVNAFWDGGRSWKVRFMPDEPGAWAYVTEVKAADTAGLHDLRGNFRATQNANAKFDLYRR